MKQLGGVLLIVAFFLPFYSLPSIGGMPPQSVSGLELIRIYRIYSDMGLSLDMMSAEQLIVLAGPFVFALAGVIALFKVRFLAVIALLYGVALAGAAWYDEGSWDAIVKYADWGFYVGLGGAALATFASND